MKASLLWLWRTEENVLQSLSVVCLRLCLMAATWLQFSKSPLLQPWCKHTGPTASKIHPPTPKQAHTNPERPHVSLRETLSRTVDFLVPIKMLEIKWINKQIINKIAIRVWATGLKGFMQRRECSLLRLTDLVGKKKKRYSRVKIFCYLLVFILIFTSHATLLKSPPFTA